MSDRLLERRRAQNRDAQRRFRQRQKDNERNTFSLDSIDLEQYDTPLSLPPPTPPTERGGERMELDRSQDELNTIAASFLDANPGAPTAGVFYCERVGYGSYTLLDGVLSIDLDTPPEEGGELVTPGDAAQPPPDHHVPGKRAAAPFAIEGAPDFSASDTASLAASSSSPYTDDSSRLTSPYAASQATPPEERETPATAATTPACDSTSRARTLPSPGGTSVASAASAASAASIASIASSAASSAAGTAGAGGGPKTSALHVAAQRGHERIVRTLLQNGAPCDLGDHGGRTPLMLATMGGHRDAAAVLLAHGARVEAVDHSRRSALHWAVVHRREALLVHLLACCADPAAIDAADTNGETPLHLAVHADFEPAVQALLSSGASMML